MSEGDDIFHVLRCQNFACLFKETVVLKYHWLDAFNLSSSTERALRSVGRSTTPRVFSSSNYGNNVCEYFVPHAFNNLPECMFGLTSKGQPKKPLSVCPSMSFCWMCYSYSLYLFNVLVRYIIPPYILCYTLNSPLLLCMYIV